MNPFISLCMIVKNEEKVLKRCLDSIKDYVDEIIIADTGSTDCTKEIAFSFTQNVYDFKWINDFSAARNFVQSKATGEWIIYLDADEYVDGNNIKETIQQLRNSEELKSYEAFVITQINFVGTLAGNVTQCPTIRIYKNTPTIGFQRKIHEQLNKSDGELSIGFLGLNVYHSGYLSKTFQDKNKGERNISLIINEIERNPNNGFDHYNLANEYLAEWKVEEALTSYRDAFRLKDSIDNLWVPMAVERIVFCLLELKRYSEALNVINDAVIQWPNAADFKSQKSLIYFMQHRFEDAEHEISELIKDRQNYSTVQSLSYLNYLPFFILGRISEYSNDMINAVYNYSQALNYNDKDTDTLKRLYPILVKNESREDIINFIKRNESMKNDVNRAFFLKILLDIGEVQMVEDFLKEWSIYPPNGFKIKLNIGKGKFNLAKSLLNKNQMSDLLDEGWIDPYDILMLALQLDKIDVFYQLIECQEIEGFSYLEVLFTEVSISDIENIKSQVVLLLERCILLKNFNLIDKIIPMAMKLNMNSEIGDLFYKYGFDDIAFELYEQMSDYSQLKEQSFVNIIESFMLNGNDEEALQWAFTALEQNYHDYRIYKAIVQLLEKRKAFEDLEKMIEIALDIYPESNYVKGFMNKCFNRV